jgi:hypothetical protein
MKVVLRHQFTGRYYSASGAWVRRSDNAMIFDDALSANNYQRSHQIDGTQAVYRLAPYLIPLLHEQDCATAVTMLGNPRATQLIPGSSAFPFNFGAN